MASRPGERCSEGKCPLSPPARSQPPFHPRSMVIGCEHVALAQHDRDVSPHSVTIKGFGGQSAPKRHNTPEAVHLARQAFELRHGVEDLSYADHPPCHPGLLGPTRLAGLRQQQGWRRAPRRDGQEVDRSRSGDQCRRSRSRPIQFGRNGISSLSRNGPHRGSTTVQPIPARSRGRMRMCRRRLPVYAVPWRLPPPSRSHRAERLPARVSHRLS
ncbi:hypothetical protein ACVWZV_009738 [Bradyrhizobium sp. GM5.1]